MSTATSLQQRLSTIKNQWSPEHILTLNCDTSFKVAKIQGDFIWHSHPNTDELFYCVSGGPMKLELATKASTPEEAEASGADDVVELKVGDMFCVPKGMQHRPRAEVETGILMVERVGTVNTGDREGDANGRTVHVNEGIGR